MSGKKSGRKQAPPKDEAKSARFVRVVTPRIMKAVKAIKVIGYCAGASYEYTPKQVSDITNVLAKALDNLANSFKTKTKPDETFTFSE